MLASGLRCFPPEALVRDRGKLLPNTNSSPILNPTCSDPRFCSHLQVTTLVTSVFLVIKVIESNVSDAAALPTSHTHSMNFCILETDSALNIPFFFFHSPVCELKLCVVIFMSDAALNSQPGVFLFRLHRSSSRMPSATCCPSPPSFWPGWRRGSSTLRFSHRRPARSEVTAATDLLHQSLDEMSYMYIF